MSIEEIEQHAAEHGLVTLTVEEYEYLTNKVSEVQNEVESTQNPDADYVLVDVQENKTSDCLLL